VPEVTNELMYETLKDIQTRIVRVEDGMREIRTEMNSMRLNMVAVQQDVANIYGILGKHSERFDRIERRLDLTEPAE